MMNFPRAGQRLGWLIILHDHSGQISLIDIIVIAANKSREAVIENIYQLSNRLSSTAMQSYPSKLTGAEEKTCSLLACLYLCIAIPCLKHSSAGVVRCCLFNCNQSINFNYHERIIQQQHTARAFLFMAFQNVFMPPSRPNASSNNQ